MLCALFAIVAAQTAPEPLLERYKSWRKASPVLVAKYKFKSYGPVWGSGALTLSSNKVRLSAVRGLEKYEMLIADGEAIDITPASSLYDRHLVAPNQMRIESNISGLSVEGYPMELLAPDLARFLPPGSKYSASKEGGKDTLKFLANDGQVLNRVVIELAPSGQPTRIVRENKSPAGANYREFVFESIKANPALPPTAFVLKAPGDFAPFRVPIRVPLVDAGEPFPTKNWVGRDGRALEQVLGGKTTLLYAVLPGDPHAALASQLAQSVGIPFLQVGAPSDKAVDVHAKTERAWIDLVRGGSPVFLLITPKGVLEHAWLGLSASIFDTTKKEIKGRIEELSKPPATGGKGGKS